MDRRCWKCLQARRHLNAKGMCDSTATEGQSFSKAPACSMCPSRTPRRGAMQVVAVFSAAVQAGRRRARGDAAAGQRRAEAGGGRADARRLLEHASQE